MQNSIKNITPIAKSLTQWYTDVIIKTELADYSEVRGCHILCPYGYAVWENITAILNKEFKKIGVENVAMPLLIPKNLFERERNHLKGFAPEVIWITHGGDKELNEQFCIRPTSEALFCSYFSNAIESWRDLPKLYNQWCSVVRWEKTSRPLLRSVEFHWQEGHTVHETPEEARSFVFKIFKIYEDFFKNVLCIPIIAGQKTESEKFAGAEETYTIECMTKDGKALQSATSHYLGDSFCKVFDVKFLNQEDEMKYPNQTSWGLSTRVIGGVIMAHGDDNGLILPPDIAPIQVIIVPIVKENVDVVIEKAREIFDRINAKFRVKIDENRKKTPGWKFTEYEMRGVPLRLELGPNDIKKESCVLVRRDTRTRTLCKLKNVEEKISELFTEIKNNLYQNALYRQNERMSEAKNSEEFFALIEGKDVFIKSSWCGDPDCEEKVKEYAYSSRCVKTGEELISPFCPICGKNAKSNIFWAKAY